MIFSLRKWRQRFTFVLLFVLLSYVLYQLLSVVSVWAQPKERYKEPSGSAVKVIQRETADEERLSLRDRLLMFYRYGE